MAGRGRGEKRGWERRNWDREGIGGREEERREGRGEGMGWDGEGRGQHEGMEKQ